MRLELWKQVVLSLSVPLMIAAAVVVYALINLNTLSNRIAHIEAADDIHFAILDLQRYEKNLLLLAEEEESVRRFREAIGTIKRKIHDIESELLREINLANYERLLDFIKRYHEQADLLVEAIKAEQELIERIRPLGRALERRSGQSYMALEMRRHEKNFLIYGEPTAVVSLRATAERLLSRQPDLSTPVGSYLQTFDEIVSRRTAKEQTVAQLRNHGQSIQEITKEFSNKERQEIDSTLVFAKKLLVASFLLLVLTVVIVSNRFSENVVRTLRTVEDSLTKRVSLGDFSHGVSVQQDLAPREIVSFVETYNQAVEALGESREELEKTMTRLGQVNRELLDKQEELVENRKLSALRLLAAEVAHEVSNPLSSLTTVLHLCVEDLPPRHPRRAALDNVLRDAEKCRMIVAKLAEFARRDPLNAIEIPAADFFHEVAAAALKQSGRNGKQVHIAVTSENMPDRFTADPVLFSQALTNIVANACDFSPDGGSVSLRALGREEDIVIEVSDEGPGIADEHMHRIFEPFFSTRKESGGSGLGLAIARKVVERHNGSISVASEPGQGVTFRILLPRSAEAYG